MSLRRLLRRIRPTRNPRTFDRHIMFTAVSGRYEYCYHATKGWRRRRR